MTVADSDVWSEALQRKKTKAGSWQVKRLSLLVQEDEVEMLGPIRQETLCGIRDQATFERIKIRLRAYLDSKFTAAIHEQAASFFNLCRGKGIQGSHTDFLICSYAVARNTKILTKDRDFKRYAKHIPIELEESQLDRRRDSS